MKCARALVSGSLSVAACTLSVGCGPEDTAAVADCDEVFLSVIRPEAPNRIDSIRPVTVSAEMPVLQARRAHDAADDLMARSLAGACIFERGLPRQDGVDAWARAAVDGSGSPFDFGETVLAEYDEQAGRLRVSVDDGPDTGVEPVSWTRAEEEARAVVTMLEDRGVVASMEYTLLLVTRGGQLGHCAEETPECRAEVEQHRFEFAPALAGVPVPRAPVEVVVGRDGELKSFLVSPRSFERVGAVAAELSEEAASDRLLELVEADIPSGEVFWEERGRLEYSLPVRETNVEMEPRLYGRFIAEGGRPVEVSLSLSDADAPLLR